MRLLGPVGQIDVAASGSPCAIGFEIHLVEVNARAVDGELCLHVRPHRHVVLDRDGASGERRSPVIVRQVADGDVEVPADDAPRRRVVFVGELAPPGAQVPQRDVDRSIPPRLAVVAAEFREVVPGVPPFDEHAPIGHLHRADRDVRLPPDGRPPVESHRDPFRREERSIAGMQAVDGEVLDQDVAGQEMDAKRSDAQRPLDVPGRLLFRRVARHRAEIDGHRHHDGRREQRHDHRQAEGGVSKNASRYARRDRGMAVFCRRSRPTKSVFLLLRHAFSAQPFEQGHRITTSSAPASTDMPSRA